MQVLPANTMGEERAQRTAAPHRKRKSQREKQSEEKEGRSCAVWLCLWLGFCLFGVVHAVLCSLCNGCRRCCIVKPNTRRKPCTEASLELHRSRKERAIPATRRFATRKLRDVPESSTAWCRSGCSSLCRFVERCVVVVVSFRRLLCRGRRVVVSSGVGWTLKSCLERNRHAMNVVP